MTRLFTTTRLFTITRLHFYLMFLFGLSCGVLVTLMFRELQNTYPEDYNQFDVSLPVVETNENSVPKDSTSNQGLVIVNDMEKIYEKDGDKVARILSTEIRVLCWIMTQPKTLKTKGQAVKDTWGKRCNVLVFISSVEDKEFPVVGLNVPEGSILIYAIQ